MTPATIIKQAQADGVNLALSPSGTIRAMGNGEAVNRWLPIIRQHKAELLDELRAANEGMYDPAAEARRQRVLTLLANNPALRLAIVCDGAGDPLPVAVAIRDNGTCEVLIPATTFDPLALLELVEKHSGTLH